MDPLLPSPSSWQAVKSWRTWLKLWIFFSLLFWNDLSSLLVSKQEWKNAWTSFFFSTYSKMEDIMNNMTTKHTTRVPLLPSKLKLSNLSNKAKKKKKIKENNLSLKIAYPIYMIWDSLFPYVCYLFIPIFALWQSTFHIHWHMLSDAYRKTVAALFVSV